MPTPPSSAPRSDGPTAPRIRILATGGTIAGAQTAGGRGYRAATLSMEALIAAVPQLAALAPLEVEQVAAIGFIVAIALLMTALWHFLLETRAATAALRIPEEYLETHREL